jgi:glucose/mannose-6-phosphate isomerase
MTARLTTPDLAPARASDPQDMIGAILGLPEQCESAKKIGLEADLGTLSRRDYSSVVLAGLGGSAIGGDFLRSCYGAHFRRPFEVVRDYHLPAFVGSDTLVFASSNSGNTEETLSAYGQARRVGATIVAFTTGGELERRARADGVPVVKFPGGLQPRAAVGNSFIPLIAASARIGLMSEALVDDIDEAIAVMRGVRGRCNPDATDDENEARRLAGAWVGKIPIIYGSQGERGLVAYRWKSQINENAKAYAVSNVFPELNHNETVGWSGANGQGAPEAILRVCILRDDREPAHIKKRVELTKEILGVQADGIDEVWAAGESALARMLSLVYLGDFASCYLAYAYGEDPTPVNVIDWLKSELAKS